MKSLITGSNGFVGAHLARHLEECGDEITGIDREYDVTDEDAMREVFGRVRPDVIYHLAALTHVGESWEHANEFTRVNVVGTHRVLDAAFGASPTSTAVVISTSEVYGIVRESDLPLAETFRVAPANPYSSSKVEAENVVHDVVRRRGQRALIARPFNHLGPGQSSNFLVPALVTRLLDAQQTGAPSISVGDLSTRRDFCDVRDVVRAYRLLAQYGLTGEAYNVASGRDVGVREVAEYLVEQIAPGVTLETDPALLRPIDLPVFRGDFHKLHVATGWEPSIALHRTLNDVISDIESRDSRVG
jgi:GDP-4-dehydro-6-deoxy-D-mannose reductase